jgi:hypothetical protein
MQSHNSRAAMFHNRISRFRFEDVNQQPENTASSQRCAFVTLPAFMVASGCQAQSANIYRMAHEQAKQQVAQRHENERRAYEWN